MPADQRRAIEEEQEIEGFLRRSHISQKNILRLREVSSGGAPELREKAERVLEIALAAPPTSGAGPGSSGGAAWTFGRA